MIDNANDYESSIYVIQSHASMKILFRHEAKIRREREFRKRGNKAIRFFFDLFIYSFNLSVG